MILRGSSAADISTLYKVQTIAVKRLLWLAAVLVGCKSAPPPAAAPSDDEAARAAAEQFLRCYEREGAECRPEDAPLKEWSAMSALALVRDGIPTEIYEQLPQLLANLREDTHIRRDFIQTLTQNHAWVRTGQCEIRRIDVVGPRALALAKAAAARVERLGMEGTETGEAVQQLSETATAVANARVVQADCKASQSSFYLVLAQNESKAWRAVGFYAAPPMWFRLEGQTPAKPAGRVRVPPPAANLVDPWLPIYEEQL